ncbi:MAG TPA: ABC transporter ATP-binding protein [Acidimicrobiales bacterium]|jgi:putative ABC transport system ATP-binding protein|nr:ABC transporter ATP-binding protein [Acidimicrobiales bacterium]
MTMSDTALRLEAVTKVYGEGDIAVHAVTDVTLAVEPGETVLIMGPSGSGKTTLLLMAGTLLRPSSGQVVLDGEEVSALSEKQLPALRLRRIGFVFQLFNLLENLTAAENVSIVMEAAGTRRRLARQQACDLLRELRLDTRADARPETLSVGERQRVAIARALANDPPLILADEPTANLDARTGHQTMEVLQQLASERNKAVVIVTHDSRIADVADRVYWLEDGRLSHRPVGAQIATDPL